MSQGVIQGSMREAPLPDIIQLVSQGGKSGCFHVEQDSAKARIYLKNGRIIHAVTQAEEGLEGLLGVAHWLEGTYRFEEGESEVPVTIANSNASILMELGRRMDEWRVIGQKVPSVALFPASTLLPGETPRGLSPREGRLLGLATGYYSVAELADALQKPVITVAKDLYGLVTAGLVTLKGARSGKPPRVKPPAPPLAPDPSHTGVEEPIPETVGGGVARAALPLEPSRPAPVTEDPQRVIKLMNFTQRIAQTAKQLLPEGQHEMVNRSQALATQQIIAGLGLDAVKGLALTISRGAVDAGCEADLVRTLNAQLKALFTSR
jgi:hypothetical protein